MDKEGSEEEFIENVDEAGAEFEVEAEVEHAQLEEADELGLELEAEKEIDPSAVGEDVQCRRRAQDTRRRSLVLRMSCW
jgi:hypothetical protein